MSIAKKIEAYVSRSSMIRKMFEEGAQLKAIYGDEKVFDFSIGNPNVKQPEKFNSLLKEIVESSNPGDHGYMPNAGYPQVRQAVANYLTKEQNKKISADEIIMTCGAAGALNIMLKAILDPGDEVISPAPCFVEYGFYADNHGGVFKTVPAKDDFTLDIEAISASITEKTKAVLINSPNNPSGQIYSKESLTELGSLLREKGMATNRTIYLISDEPYRKIVYDGNSVPGIFNCYPESIIATSYSKDLSLPGERIGFAAINPDATYKNDLIQGMILANRILGFVNAPALMQRVVAALQGVKVDISEYERKRNILCEGLKRAGYEFILPKGAFYLFPKSPIKDDGEFIRMLKEEMILAVPGSGFNCPGHFRIAYCVEDKTIINAIPGFERALKKAKKED
jgi:aspartate aminotransferase